MINIDIIIVLKNQGLDHQKSGKAKLNLRVIGQNTNKVPKDKNI